MSRRRTQAIGESVSRTTSAKGIGAIEHSGLLLRALIAAGEPQPLKDIAKRAAMSPSKAWRYLLSFTRIGLVEQNPETGHYRLGPLALQLGLTALSSMDVVKLGVPVVSELRNRTHETTVLAVWATNGPTVVHIEESRQPVTLNVRAGSTLPLLKSATGMIFAAYLPREMTEEFLRREIDDAEEPVDLRSIEVALVNVRHTRFCRVDGLLIQGVTALSSPVFDHVGSIAAVMTLVVHRDSPNLESDGPLATELVAAAMRLSSRLGWTPEVRKDGSC